MTQLDLTTSIVEVTVDYCEGAVFAHMILEVLTLWTCPTIIWAGDWVECTNWPVLTSDVIEIGFVVVTIFTAKGTLKTL